LAFLQKSASGGIVPKELEQVIEFRRAGHLHRVEGAFLGPAWVERFVNRPAAHRIKADSNALLAVAGVEDAVRALWEGGDEPVALFDARGAPISNPSFDQVRRPVCERLLEDVRVFVNETDGFQFDSKLFEQVYERRHLFDLRDEMEYDVTVPLFGFSAQAWPIRLSGSVRIDALSAEEKTELWRKGAFAGFSDFDSFASCGFALRHNYWAREGNTHEASVAAQRTTYRAINALRLLHEGNVRATASALRIVELGERYTGGVGSLDDWSYRGLPFDPYVFRHSEEQDARELFEQLQLLETSGAYRQLEIAIRRFNQTYSRERHEDQIVDLTIALEGCLLFGIQNELSYRLAMRGAALLRSDQTPERTAGFLRSLYEVRSMIVHEGLTLEELATHKSHKKLFSNKAPHHILASEARSCVRKVLKTLIYKLATGGSIRSITSELDSLILKSLTSATP
jgi:hypothetical protein